MWHNFLDAMHGSSSRSTFWSCTCVYKLVKRFLPQLCFHRAFLRPSFEKHWYISELVQLIKKNVYISPVDCFAINSLAAVCSSDWLHSCDF